MTGYQVVPIGWVESPLKDRAQAPRQGDEGAPDAWLVFQPEVAEGIRDLAAGAEIIVLTWLDRAARNVLVTRPRDDPARPPTGVFSTRSPDRPTRSGCTGSRSSRPRDCGSWSGLWRRSTRRRLSM